MSEDARKSAEMVQGTLDMLIMRTLITGPAHGHTIAHVIEHTSDNVLEVEQGSLYPALHRLEYRGWVTSYWPAAPERSVSASPSAPSVAQSSG
jgi:PadR family transcriptional regulator PadR